MNQLFNFHRFGFLLKLHFVQNGKSQLFSAGLIVGLMLIFMTPMLASRGYSHMAELLHILAFFICILLGGNLFASTVFSQYSEPGSGISAIMVPASRLEKFLVTLLVSLAFMILFVSVYWQLHFGIINLVNQNLPSEGRKYFQIPSETRIFLNYCYFFIFGAVFLGSIYFPKYSFVKSVGVLLLISLLAFFLHYGMAYYFTSYSSSLLTVPFTSWRFSRGTNYLVSFPEPVDNFVWIFLITLVLSLWYIAYLRLKEKEI